MSIYIQESENTPSIENGNYPSEPIVVNFDKLAELGKLSCPIQWLLLLPSTEPVVETDKSSLRLLNTLYGREDLDARLNEMASGAPSLESIWQITQRLPSLTDILVEERNNE